MLVLRCLLQKPSLREDHEHACMNIERLESPQMIHPRPPATRVVTESNAIDDLDDVKNTFRAQSSRRGSVRIQHATNSVVGSVRCFRINEDKDGQNNGDDVVEADDDEVIEQEKSDLDLIDREVVAAQLHAEVAGPSGGPSQAAQCERFLRTVFLQGEMVLYDIGRNGEICHASSPLPIGRRTGGFGDATKTHNQLSWSMQCKQCRKCRILKSNKQLVEMGDDEELLVKWLLL